MKEKLGHDVELQQYAYYRVLLQSQIIQIILLQMTLFQQQLDMQGHRLMHQIIQTQRNVFISGTSTVSRVLCCVEDFSSGVLS